MLHESLKTLPKGQRVLYLRQKYRELKLLKACDRLTDKYAKFPALMNHTLRLISRFFKCEFAAFMRFDDEHFGADDFILKGPGKDIPEQTNRLICDLLKTFLQEPRPQVLENAPRSSFVAIGVKNYLIIPMILNAELEGAFLIANRDVPFAVDDEYLLQTASSQIDNAIVFARTMTKQRKLAGELRRRRRELDILYNMSVSLSVGYDFESLARKVLENVMTLARIDRASVMVFDPAKEELITVVVVGESKNIKLVKLGKGRGIAGLVLATGKPIITSVGSADERFVPYDFSSFSPRRIHALASIPLLTDNKPIGVLNFSMLSPGKRFHDKHTEILNAAAHMISLGYQRQKYYHLSIKDELTGLFSFRYFQGRLREEAIKAARYNYSFSLVLFDLDHFKSTNDTYGHQFGNVALKKVAETIIAQIRVGADMVARYGGEEMVLIMPHTDQEGGRLVAERIRSQVEALHLECNGQLVPITISGGLAQFPLNAGEPDLLLKMADEALYKAKEGGRNRIVLT